MSYEVLAVGGSGQWFLLELCCWIARDPAFQRPQAVWVVDPDWVPSTPSEEDKRGLAWVVQRSLDELGIPATSVRPELERARTMEEWVNRDRDHLAAICITDQEIQTSFEEGFYARPRLAAMCASVGRLVQSQSHQPVPLLDDRDQESPAGNLGTPGPALLVVGSLMGGTGAGLLPYFAQRLRRNPAREWKRQVVIAALLPWFNPELARGSTVRWVDCCLNANRGVQALQDVHEELLGRLRAVNGHDLAYAGHTRFLLLGDPLAAAKARNPQSLAPLERKDAGTIDGVLARLVEAIPQLLSTPPNEQDEQLAEKKVHWQTLLQAVARPRRDAGALPPGAAPERPLAEIASQVAALRAKSLSTAGGSERIWLGRLFVPVSGYGEVLGGVLRSAALGGPAAGREMYTEFTRQLGQLASRARGTDGGLLQPDVAPTLLADQGAAIKELDRAIPDRATRKRLWTLMDGKRSEADREDKARTSASLVFRALLRAADTRGPDALATFLGEGREWGWSPLLPVDVRIPPGAVTSRLSTYGIPAQATVDVLRRLRVEAGADDEDCRSMAYARWFGSAHVLEERVEAPELLSVSPRPGSARHRALMMWCAASRGLLTLAPVPPGQLTGVDVTEGPTWRDKFGEPRLVRLREGGPTIGLFLANLGFVPRAEVVEHGRPFSLDEVLKSGSGAISEDLERVRAWAEFQCMEVLGHPPPWYRLLTAGHRQPEAAARTLPADCVAGMRVLLSKGGRIEDVSLPLHVPLGLRNQLAERWGTRQLAEVPDTNGGTLHFRPFGDDSESKPVVGYAGGAARKRVLWIDPSLPAALEGVRRAADRAPVNIDWETW